MTFIDALALFNHLNKAYALLGLIDHGFLRVVCFTSFLVWFPVFLLVSLCAIDYFFALTTGFLCLFKTILTHFVSHFFSIVSVVTYNRFYLRVPVLLKRLIVTIIISSCGYFCWVKKSGTITYQFPIIEIKTSIEYFHFFSIFNLKFGRMATPKVHSEKLCFKKPQIAVDTVVTHLTRFFKFLVV